MLTGYYHQDSWEDFRNQEILQLIEKLTPKIKSSIKNTSYQEQEDLEQELIVKIIEKFQMFEDEENPGFWDFVQQKKEISESNKIGENNDFV